METGMERQLEIYRKGLFGMPEQFPVDAESLEAAARAAMKPEAYDYVAGSAGTEATADANRRAFAIWQIVPRFLRDVSQRDWSVELFGRRYPAPIYVAPVGVQGIIHPDGELATARACAKLGVPFTLSTVASYTIEQTVLPSISAVSCATSSASATMFAQPLKSFTEPGSVASTRSV